MTSNMTAGTRLPRDVVGSTRPLPVGDSGSEWAPVLKRIAASVVAAVAALAGAEAPAGTLQASATLNVDQSGPRISKYVYSQFSEHLGGGIYDGIWVGKDSAIPNVRGIRSDVVAALRAIKTPLVRWPGGCFADEYLWRDGIGPREDRPVRRNNWWGGSPESNAFGTHEFMDFVEQVGAEAYVAINLGSSTPSVMREWVEYMTSPGADTLAQERRRNGRDQPWRVAMWGVGNEAWGCGGHMTASHYANELRRFSTFLHRSGDPPSERVATGPSGGDTAWTEVLMRDAGDALDAISLHYYTLPTGKWEGKGSATGFTEQEWVKTFAETLKIEGFIQQHVAVMQKYDPANRVGLYVDEWGTWYDVEKDTNPGHLYQQNTLRDAVLAAANLNIFHRHAERVRMSSIAQTINVLQSMVLTEGKDMALTPTYYTYKMYLPFQDATSLPLELASPDTRIGDVTIPTLSASAARGGDGRIHLGIANMNPRDDVRLHVNLQGVTPRRLHGQRLTSARMDAHNVPGEPEQIAPAPYTGGRVLENSLELLIPAKSVVVVTVEP